MLISRKIHVQSVFEITRSIKNHLESTYRFVHVQGEVTNLRCPFSGHLYFTLKDSSAQIKAVLFKGQKKYLAMEIENGQQVICHGRISVYEPRGDYQLIVDTVDLYGSGHLQAKFDKLKQRLSDEGLFASSKKKSIPLFPEKIVLVTSSSGAALFDFLKISKMQRTFADILIYPVQVQGKGAAEKISEAIQKINDEKNAEIIALCRGGGSIEDLWAFNEEPVARAIFDSAIPVVTGIGHEIDTTIADLCADVRTSTPTAAAELLFLDRGQVELRLEKMTNQLVTFMLSFIEHKQYQIHQNERLLGNMDSTFITMSLRLDLEVSELYKAIQNIVHCQTSKVQTLASRLQTQLPATKIKLQEQRLSFAMERICYHIKGQLKQKQTDLSRHMIQLDSVSPLSILARGYSLVTHTGHASSKQKLVKASDQVSIGEKLDIRLHDGALECTVTGKQ